MKVLFSLLLLLILSMADSAQEKPHWQRLCTFDESSVDLDTSTVTFGSDFSGRVRFRFSYTKSQTAPAKPFARYKNAIEAIEFDCLKHRYRVVSVERFDGDGKLTDSEDIGSSAQWKPVKWGTLNEKLMERGCSLISDKRRNP